MIQPLLQTTWRQLTIVGLPALFFFLNGCVTSTEFSRHTVAEGQVVSGRRSSKVGFDDPFRRPSTANRDSDGPNAALIWSTVAASGSGEPLQTVSLGSGGFRSLVVGSVAGHDPVAVRLTEELARYVRQNYRIMGGVNVTVLRTLNPDGMQDRRQENSSGVYLNHMFPKDGSLSAPAELSRLPAEIRFLTGFVSDQRPQRIVHVRTVRGSRGMLAASHGAMDAGREVADWLGFTVRELPRDVRDGTLESWAARRGDCDVITFGVPRRTAADEVWAFYGDAVLSLLLDGDSESRRIAREEQKRRSARRPRHWDAANNDTFDRMFQENR
ncbi:MAG: hypothetical protein ABGZ35_33205 [Planctomycetaceae bacterium]